MEARTGRSVQEHPSTPAITAPAPVPPPSTRRPRVREVSSRFMSPVSSSSSSSSLGDLHSNSPRHLHHNHQKSRRQLKLSDGGENRSSETAARSLDSPFPLQQDGGKTTRIVRSRWKRTDTVSTLRRRRCYLRRLDLDWTNSVCLPLQPRLGFSDYLSPRTVKRIKTEIISPTAQITQSSSTRPPPHLFADPWVRLATTLELRCRLKVRRCLRWHLTRRVKPKQRDRRKF